MRSFAVSAVVAGVVSGAVASSTVALAAGTTVLTIAGSTLIVRDPMSAELQGALCQAPAYSCEAVPYRSSAIGRAPLEEGIKNLQEALSEHPGEVIVLAYSQGGMIASPWLVRHGEDAARQDDVVLVLLGSPQHGRGGLGPAVGSSTRTPTPTDTGYTVIEVSREYDLEADFPANRFNLLAVANAFAGYAGVHADYTGVDLFDPNNLVYQKGGTTYVLVPTEILPLVQPLTWFGLRGLAVSLSQLLKPMIDSAYDRSGYVTLAEAVDAGWDLPDVLTAGYQSAAPITGLVQERRSGLDMSAQFDAGVPFAADAVISGNDAPNLLSAEPIELDPADGDELDDDELDLDGGDEELDLDVGDGELGEIGDADDEFEEEAPEEEALDEPDDEISDADSEEPDGPESPDADADHGDDDGTADDGAAA